MKMEFRIIEGSEEALPKEGFYIKVDSYIGDLDYNDSFTVGPFPQDKVNYLKEVVDLLEKLDNIKPDQYDSLKGFSFWFDEGGCDEWDENDPKIMFLESLTFKNEAMSYCSGWNSWEGYKYRLSSYKVHYIDENGRKKKVEIIKGKK